MKSPRHNYSTSLQMFGHNLLSQSGEKGLSKSRAECLLGKKKKERRIYRDDDGNA